MNEVDGKAEPEQLLATAARQIECGEFEHARGLCEQVLARLPGDVDALATLGRVAMLQLRWQDAIELFDRAMRVRADPWTLANLGNCYWKTGDLDQAEYCLRGALELRPELTAARVGVATVLHARHRFDDALAELDVGVNTQLANHQIESRRGCALARLGKFDEAQAAFQRASAGAGSFIYSRLVAFDRATWDAVCADAQPLRAPQAAFATARAGGARGHVTLISCNPPYVRKFGLAFLRSYAEHAQGDGIVHLHIYDPDDSIVNEVRALAEVCGLAHFVVTTEQSPFPPERPRQRKAYYACGRLAHMEYWLAHYARPVLSLDVDFIVEDRLEAIVAAAAGADVALNPRVPIDSPWLDVIANIIVANPTPAACAYFAAVRNYALAMIEREPEAWLVDQTALYCVLAMARRYATPPAVVWLRPEAAQGRLWHMGHAYGHLLNDARYLKYAGESS